MHTRKARNTHAIKRLPARGQQTSTSNFIMSNYYQTCSYISWSTIWNPLVLVGYHVLDLIHMMGKSVTSPAYCTLRELSRVDLMGMPSLLKTRIPSTPLCELILLNVSSTTETSDILAPLHQQRNFAEPTTRPIWKRLTFRNLLFTYPEIHLPSLENPESCLAPFSPVQGIWSDGYNTRYKICHSPLASNPAVVEGRVGCLWWSGVIV